MPQDMSTPPPPPEKHASKPPLGLPSIRCLAQVEVAHKFATPKTLVQQYLFIPAKHKDCYLAYVLNEFAGQSTIVFVSTCNNAQVTRGKKNIRCLNEPFHAYIYVYTL